MVKPNPKSQRRQQFKNLGNKMFKHTTFRVLCNFRCISRQVYMRDVLGTELSLSSRGRMTLGVGEIFWFISHTMPCQPKRLGLHIYSWPRQPGICRDASLRCCPSNHHVKDHKDQQYKDLFHQWILTACKNSTTLDSFIASVKYLDRAWITK